MLEVAVGCVLRSKRNKTLLRVETVTQYFSVLLRKRVLTSLSLKFRYESEFEILKIKND